MLDPDQKMVLQEYSLMVSQESTLCSTLFDIYLKLLGEVIRRLDLHCHQYSDDTQLYLRPPSNTREEVEMLGSGDGLDEGELSYLNPDIIEVMLVGLNSALRNGYTMMPNGEVLPPVRSGS